MILILVKKYLKDNVIKNLKLFFKHYFITIFKFSLFLHRFHNYCEKINCVHNCNLYITLKPRHNRDDLKVKEFPSSIPSLPQG